MASSPHSDSSYHHDDGRKRVAKACDRCRLKKIKCDGKIPCSRCSLENQICQFGERKKSIERRIPAGYVEYLEDQQKVLVKALKKTWQTQHRNGSEPDIHTIIKKLGVLADVPSSRSRRDGAFWFEEDNEKARQQFEEAELDDVKSLSPSSIKREDTPLVDSPMSESFGADNQPKFEQPSPFGYSMPQPMSQDYQSQYYQWASSSSRTQTPLSQSLGPMTPPEMDSQGYEMDPSFNSMDFMGQTMSPNNMFINTNTNWDMNDLEMLSVSQPHMPLGAA